VLKIEKPFQSKESDRRCVLMLDEFPSCGVAERGVRVSPLDGARLTVTDCGRAFAGGLVAVTVDGVLGSFS